MVGKGVLIECLDRPEITEVLSIGRRSLDMEHPKLKELIHKDFSEFESVKKQLQGYDACYACMGVSSAGMDEAKYTVLTYDYTMALANVLYDVKPKMTYTYVTGQGTDSSEKGRSMWGRVKGRTENDLIAKGFAQAFMFRPGMIIPVRGVKPSSKLYQFMIKYLTWLLKLIKNIAPNQVVTTAQIGQAMINATINGYDKNVLLPKDILTLNEK